MSCTVSSERTLSTGRRRSQGVVAVPLAGDLTPVLCQIAAELALEVIEWTPVGPAVAPVASAIIVLAGRREHEALELLADLPTPPVPIYLVGCAADHRIAAAALQRGARDYFALPDDRDLLRRSIERDVRQAEALDAAAAFAESERTTAGFNAILGQSDALQTTLTQAARVAPHRDVTVLVRGETGTGKELLARAIHYHSPRAAEPFVEINCAAIPAMLLESELFGHEKGSFTGATSTKPGLFELAHGGTLFLDEIGNLPIELQPKLLRALESRRIRRVGGSHERDVDVRIIAATHVDLAAAVARGEFREDLYYRLNVVALTLPPLRYRDGDVDLIAEHFLARLAESYRLPVPPLTPLVRTALHAHHWPGNVRELRNAIERALVLSPPGTLHADELMIENGNSNGQAPGLLPFPADLATLSRAAAHAMVDLTGGNKSEAARRLGISRPRLQRLLYAVDIDA